MLPVTTRLINLGPPATESSGTVSPQNGEQKSEAKKLPGATEATASWLKNFTAPFF